MSCDSPKQESHQGPHEVAELSPAWFGPVAQVPHTEVSAGTTQDLPLSQSC